MKMARGIFGNEITYAAKNYDALKGADALAIVTEWNEFREPGLRADAQADALAGHLRRPQHLHARADEARGFTYYSIGALIVAASSVTGGAGYIGSHAVQGARRAGHAWSSTTTCRPGTREAVARRAAGRGRHPRRRRRPTRCATRRRRGDALRRLAQCRRIGPRSGRLLPQQRRRHAGVLEAMADAGRAAHFVFSSTCAVYGEPVETPIDETHPTAPDQRLRRDEAGGRARAAALRARLRHALGRAALLQRRRRRSGRRARRGSRAGDPPHSARDRGGDRRARSRCSARTIRRPTAPACATTSTSATWPTRTSGRSRR